MRTSDTSDERRQAAAEFRRAAREQYEFDGENFLDCVGTYLGDAYTDGAAWVRLADLIDPVCHRVLEDETQVCSECGGDLDERYGWNYCPCCGARITEVS